MCPTNPNSSVSLSIGSLDSEIFSNGPGMKTDMGYSPWIRKYWNLFHMEVAILWTLRPSEWFRSRRTWGKKEGTQIGR